ncbi:hypothetical protein ACFY8C_39970, partial [Streptomyces flavochromogenes]
RAAGQLPAAPPPPAGPEVPALLELADLPDQDGVRGEECPYCRDVVVGLVEHLRRCPERPGAAGEDGRDWFEPRQEPDLRRAVRPGQAQPLQLPEE